MSRLKAQGQRDRLPSHGGPSVVCYSSLGDPLCPAFPPGASMSVHGSQGWGSDHFQSDGLAEGDQCVSMSVQSPGLLAAHQAPSPDLVGHWAAHILPPLSLDTPGSILVSPQPGDRWHWGAARELASGQGLASPSLGAGVLALVQLAAALGPTPWASEAQDQAAPLAP